MGIYSLESVSSVYLDRLNNSQYSSSSFNSSKYGNSAYDSLMGRASSSLNNIKSIINKDNTNSESPSLKEIGIASSLLILGSAVTLYNYREPIRNKLDEFWRQRRGNTNRLPNQSSGITTNHLHNNSPINFPHRNVSSNIEANKLPVPRELDFPELNNILASSDRQINFTHSYSIDLYSNDNLSNLRGYTNNTARSVGNYNFLSLNSPVNASQLPDQELPVLKNSIGNLFSSNPVNVRQLTNPKSSSQQLTNITSPISNNINNNLAPISLDPHTNKVSLTIYGYQSNIYPNVSPFPDTSLTVSEQHTEATFKASTSAIDPSNTASVPSSQFKRPGVELEVEPPHSVTRRNTLGNIYNLRNNTEIAESLRGSGLRSLSEVSLKALNQSQRSLSKLAGPIGLGLIGATAIGTTLGGINFLSNAYTGIFSLFAGMSTGNKLAGIKDEHGLPVLPSGDVYGGLSRSKTYVEGVQVIDPTEPTYSTGNAGFNQSVITSAAIGAVGGYGLLTAMDATSKAVLSNSGVVGDTFESVFESGYRDKGKLVFGRNFSPLLIGALAGGVLESRDDDGNVIAGSLAGATVGSFVGFMTMKEEIGPLFNKRLGVPLIGAVAGLVLAGRSDIEGTVYNKVGGQYNVVYEDTAERIRRGEAQIPYDLYANPYNEEIINAYLERERSFDLSKQYVRNPDSYSNIEPYITTDSIQSDFASKLNVPDYQTLENYVLTPGLATSEDINASTKAVEGLNQGFLSYQMGYIMPMLAVVGVSGFMRSKLGKRIDRKISKGIDSLISGNIFRRRSGGNINTVSPTNSINRVDEALELLSTYDLKIKYQYPGEREIGKSFGPILKGIATGNQRRIAVGVEHMKRGIGLRMKGEVISTAKSLAIYAPLIIGTKVLSNRIFQDTVRKSEDRYNTNHWGGIRSVFRSSKNKEINQALNLQKYLLEGKVTRIDNTLLYDSANIGYGLKDFLYSAEDDSVKALLYKTGGNQELIRVLSEKGAYEGIGVSAGGALSPNPMENIRSAFNPNEDHLGYALTYPLKVLNDSGPFHAIATITNPIIGTISNSIVTNLGGTQPFGTGEASGNALGNLINASVFGTVSFTATGMLSRSRKLAMGAGLTAALVGAILPTNIDNYFYGAAKKQGAYLVEGPKGYLRHQALTEPNATTNMLMGIASSAGAGMIAGSALSMLTRNRSVNRAFRSGVMGAVLGVGANMVSSYLQGDGLRPNISTGLGKMLTGDVEFRDKSFSILTGGGYGRGQYQHIHSKVLWTETEGKEEVFISTGNLETVWTTGYGKEKQFNLAVRIGGQQAKGLIGQLNLLHEFTKGMTPTTAVSDFEAIADAMPNFVLGGEGSDSIQHIINFLQTSEGDVMISAPYMSLSDNPGKIAALVEAVKQLEERGQDVTIVGQNPRGIMAGGRPDLSEKIFKELMAAGVDIYSAPKGADNLTHAKFIADTKRLFLTSHNLFSKNSANSVIEVGMILEGQEHADAAKQAAYRYMVNNNFERIDPQAYGILNFMEGLGGSKQLRGLSNFVDDSGGSLLMSSKMGASFFYSRALHNNLMRQAGYHSHVMTYKDFGIASALYRQAYISKAAANLKGHNLDNLPSIDYHIPWAIRRFDEELLTQGLGGWFNERVSMPLGLGRLYKDEYGVLPSIGGAIGSVLDRSYLYFTGTNVPGLTSREQNITAGTQGYRESATREGSFQQLFTQLPFLAQSAAEATLFYVTVGEPLNLLFSEGIKSNMESLISDALNPDIKKFRSTVTSATRSGSLGFGYDLQTPLEARIKLINNIDSSKRGFYESGNFGFSLYHINSTILRRRSEILMNNVMKPFLMTIVNPYKKSHLKSQDAFLEIIEDLAEEMGLPVDLRYTVPTADSEPIIGVLKRLDKTKKTLSKSLSDVEISQLGIERIMGYKNIKNRVFYQVQDFINTLDPSTTGNIITSFGTKFQDPDQYKVDELLEFLDSNQHEGESLLMRNRRGLITASTITTDDLNRLESTEFGRQFESIQFDITNVGRDRASRIAYKVQGLLDEIPLNPLYWSWFNRDKNRADLFSLPHGGVVRVTDKEGYVQPHTRMFGDVFSFTDLADMMDDVLFSRTGLGSWIKSTNISTNNYRELIESQNNTPTRQPKGIERINRQVDLIRKTLVDRIHSNWSLGVKGIGSWLRNNIERHRIITGSAIPFIGKFKKGSPGILYSARALKAMEYGLYSTDIGEGRRGIRWGSDLDYYRTGMLEGGPIYEEAAAEWNKLDNSFKSNWLAKGRDKRQWIDDYISRLSDIEFNPLAKTIDHVDESVYLAVEKVNEVNATLAKRMGPNALIEMNNYLRKESLGFFRISYMNNKELSRRIHKLHPGLGTDAIGKISKGKAGTALLGVLAGSSFLQQLMSNTGGVSLLTQVMTALTTGGGAISKVLGNDQGELKQGVQFETSRLFSLGGGLGNSVMGVLVTNAISLGIASYIGTNTLSVAGGLETHSYEGLRRFYDIDENLSPNKTLVRTRLLVDLDGDGNYIDIARKVDVSQLNALQLSDRIQELGIRKAKLQYTKIREGVEVGEQLIKATVDKKGISWMGGTPTIKGNALRNTLIAYTVISSGSALARKATAGFLNWNRNNLESLDPYIYGAVVGSTFGTLAKGSGRAFGATLIGGLVGMGLGAISNSMGMNVFDLGSRGMKIDNVDTQITAQLADLSMYLRQSIKDNRASRAELMAALWLDKFVDSKSIMEKEAYGATSKVLAKQVVLPIIQFFMSEKTIGERRNFRGEITDPGNKYFSVGIQGPPILGLSFGIHLPFKVYTKGGATPLGIKTGLAVNEEYDLVDLMYDVTAVSSSFYIASKSLDLLDATTKTAVRKTFRNSVHSSLKYKVGAIGQTSKFMKGIGTTVDSLTFIPEMAHRLVYNLTAVDWQLANEVGNSKLLSSSASQMSKFSRISTYIAGTSTRAVQAVIVGGIIGRIVGGVTTAQNDVDYYNNMNNGAWIGAAAGLAAAGSWQAIQVKYGASNLMDRGRDLINNSIQRTSTGREVSAKFNKLATSINPRAAKGIRRLSGNLLLAATAATLFTDRGFGISEGMDDSIAHRLGVITGYSAIVGGVIATGMGSLGQDSVENLVRYAERMHILDGNLNPFETKRFNKVTSGDTPDQIRVKFYEVFGKDEASVRTMRMRGIITRSHIENLEKEADHVVELLHIHRKTVIARYEIEAARLSPDELVNSKFYHLHESLNIVQNSTKRTAKEILSDDSAGKFLYHMTRSRGAFINSRVSFRTGSRRLIKAAIVPAFVGAMGFQLSKGLLGDQVINKFFGTLEGKTNNFLSSAIRSNKIFTYLGEVAADVTRLITFTDSSADSGIYLDRTIRDGDKFGAFESQVSYSKLRSIGHGPSRSLNNLIEQMNELTIRDDVNTFLSLGNVGFTFRDGDKGETLSPYVQIQGAGSDISTASYMMVSRFLFKSALYGNNDFFYRVVKAMEPLSELQRSGISDIEIQRKMVRRAALKTLTITASLQPRRKPRKISSVPEGIVKAMGRDSLLSSIMRNRRQMTRNLSFQPAESLVTRLMMSQLTTNHKYIDSMMIAALDPEAAAKMGLDNKIIQQLLTGDPFYNLLRNINITNINIFGSDPNKKGQVQVKSRRGSVEQVFAEYDTPYLNQYIERPTNLLESPWFDNINRMFDVLPGPLKPVFMLLTGSLMALSVIGFIGSRGIRADKLLELNGDVIEYFGSPWFNNLDNGLRSLWHERGYPLPGNVKVKDTAVMIKGNYQRFIHPIVSEYEIGKRFRQSLGEIQLELELLAKYGFGEDGITIGKVRAGGGLSGIVDDIKHGRQHGQNIANYWMSKKKIDQLKDIVEGRPSTWNLPDRTFQPFEMFDTTGAKFTFEINPTDSIQQNIDRLNQYSERINLTINDIETGVNNGNLIEKNGQLYRRVRKPKIVNVGGVKKNIIVPQDIPLGLSKSEISGLIPGVDQQLVALNKQLTLFQDSSINPRALTEALTETLMEEMDVFIENFYGTIADKSISLNEGQLKTIVSRYYGEEAGETILNRIFKPIDQGGITFKTDAFGRKSYNLNMLALMAASDSGGGSTATVDELLRVSNILETNRNAGYEELYGLFSEQQRSLIFSSEDPADKSLVNLMKRRSSLEIRKAIELHLHSKGYDIKNVRQLLNDGVTGTMDRQMQELALSVSRTLIGKDQADKSLFSTFRHGWGHLGSTPSTNILSKTRNLLGRVVRLNKKQNVVGSIASDEVINAITDHSITNNATGSRRPRIGLTRQVDANWMDAMIQIADAEASNASLLSQGAKTTGVLWEGLSLLGDTLEGLNIFAAMGRVSRAFGSGNMTEAQKLGVSQEAGAILLNVAIGLTQLVAIHSVMAYGGTALAKLGVASALGLGIGGLLIGGALVGAGFIGWNLLDNQTKDNIKSGVTNGWSKGWKGLQNALGRTVYNGAHFADKLGTTIGGDSMGRRFASGAAGAVGGGIGGLILGVGAITTSWISGALLGTAMVGMGGLVMAAGAGLVAGAAIGGLAYMIAPETMSKLTTNAIDGLSQITVGNFPIFALFVNRSGDHFRVQGFTAPVRGVSKASPLMVDTVGDAIKRDYSDFLAAASDETGSSVVSKLLSNTIAGGNDWGGERIFQQKYGNIQTIRPKGVSDPLINRTLRIRGKMYVQSIIGEYTWAKILATSKNTRQIKAAIEKHGRELSTISNSEANLSKEVKAALNTNNNKMTTLKKSINPKAIELIAEYKGTIDETINQELERNKPKIATSRKENITDTDLEYNRELNLVTSYITINSNYLKDNIVSITNSDDANLLEYISGKQNPNSSLIPETV